MFDWRACHNAAIVEPQKHDSKAELREWLGLTWADLLVYLSIGAVVTMFFVRHATLDAVLAVLGVVLSVIACPLGMKRNPKLPDYANVIKQWSYIPLVIAVLIAIAVHYAFFNR